MLSEPCKNVCALEKLDTQLEHKKNARSMQLLACCFVAVFLVSGRHSKLTDQHVESDYVIKQ